ncbi:DUF4148 domain-containing protein [Burkholderia alba]|uniref:DUF4148 domain-containing protein n=1 Tax=Burkholderia alba TaxID=2683677 RepID=UPI002B061061|nr:DUF4148 domain-containing protein [Burkholderia alba]
MKVRPLVVMLLAAVAATSSFASTHAPEPGKTREEVRRELIQAYRDGFLPTKDTDYPPSPATRARNREILQAANPSWLREQ